MHLAYAGKRFNYYCYDAGRKGSEDALQAAMDKFEAAGGYDADKRIANVLTGLGFKQEEWNKSCSEFSGGWQVRPRHHHQFACNTCLYHRCCCICASASGSCF